VYRLLYRAIATNSGDPGETPSSARFQRCLGNMLPEERRNKILEMLNGGSLRSVTELVEQLDVSRVTVVRDLTFLEKAGIVTKVHGGAKLRQEEQPRYEALFRVRMGKNLQKKQAIGREAALLPKDDSTIFIDSSTTCYIFAMELLKRKFARLSIITTSPSILGSNAAKETPGVTVIATGGELNPVFNMLGGLWVVDFLEKINFDAAFISVSGISEKFNLTTSSIDLANILNKVISKTPRVNLLADSSKLSKQEMVNICPLSRCFRLITDDGIAQDREKRFRDIVELKIARSKG
jgi:DeoR/GlpR family transcriptional regulator of sugar metabolism